MIPQILQHPDPRLRQVSREVAFFDSTLTDLVLRMQLAIQHSPVECLGLAAIQIGEPYRVIIVVQGKQQIVMVNPRIAHTRGIQRVRDGCLSVQGGRYFVARTRPASLVVEYQDMKGNSTRRRAEKVHAAAIAHEIDHLDGKLFIDALTGKAA